MKFPVISKTQKIAFAILLCIVVLALLVFVFLGVVLKLDLIQGFIEAGWLVIVFTVILFSVGILAVIASLYLMCLSVEINDTGIELRLGKIVINKLDWQEIKWVETFYEVNKYACRQHIAVSKRNNWQYKRERHFLLQNFTRNKITFNYDDNAMYLIKKHCDCNIYGQD